MPTQIIDNFEVSVSKPIDNRFVVGGGSFYSSKDSITWKYAGLRIWDLNASLSYVWTGATWSNESSSGALVSGTTTNYVPKFSSSNVITNSLIYDSGTNIGIGTTTPTYKLHVNGTLNATTLYGNGANLTALNATELTSGTLPLARLTGGAANQILVSPGGAPTWQNLSGLTVGASSTVTITDDISSTSAKYISFVDATSGNQSHKVSSSKLQYKPSSGQLLMENGTAALPTLSFISDTNTGIYRMGSDNIGFSTNGISRMSIYNNVVTITHPTPSTINTSSFHLNNPVRNTPTLLNGWTNYGGTLTPASYYREGSRVFLSGFVKKTTTNLLNLPIFTIDASLRPKKDIMFLVPSNINHIHALVNYNDRTSQCIVYINTVGSVYVTLLQYFSGSGQTWSNTEGMGDPASSITATNWLSLNGISFGLYDE